MICQEFSFFLRCTNVHTGQQFVAWDFVDSVVLTWCNDNRLQRYILRAMYRSRLVPRTAEIRWFRRRRSCGVDAFVTPYWHVVAEDSYGLVASNQPRPEHGLFNVNARVERLSITRKAWLDKNTQALVFTVQHGPTCHAAATIRFLVGDTNCILVTDSTVAPTNMFAPSETIEVARWRAGRREFRRKPPYRVRVFIPTPDAKGYWNRLDKVPNRTVRFESKRQLSCERERLIYGAGGEYRPGMLEKIVSSAPKLFDWLPRLQDIADDNIVAYKDKEDDRIVAYGLKLIFRQRGEPGTDPAPSFPRLILLENDADWVTNLERALFAARVP